MLQALKYARRSSLCVKDSRRTYQSRRRSRRELHKHLDCILAHSAVVRPRIASCLGATTSSSGRTRSNCWRGKRVNQLCHSWYSGEFSSNHDELVALDVEWVHVGRRPVQLLPAEVCIVGSLSTYFHTFCCPTAEQIQGRPVTGGVPRKKWQYAPGTEAVRSMLHSIVDGRVLVGYNLKADLHGLGMSHPEHLCRDLMRSSRMQRRSGQAPSLRYLADLHLHRDIQNGRHSAREDAQACLDLYMYFCQDDPDLVPTDQLEAYYLAQLTPRLPDDL